MYNLSGECSTKMRRALFLSFFCGCLCGFCYLEFCNELSHGLLVLNEELATNIVHASACLPLPSRMASLQAADPIERIVYRMLNQKITPIAGPIKRSSLLVS